jgi:hypothetical protein
MAKEKKVAADTGKVSWPAYAQAVVAAQLPAIANALWLQPTSALMER